MGNQSCYLKENACRRCPDINITHECSECPNFFSTDISSEAESLRGAAPITGSKSSQNRRSKNALGYVPEYKETMDDIHRSKKDISRMYQRRNELGKSFQESEGNKTYTFDNHLKYLEARSWSSNENRSEEEKSRQETTSKLVNLDPTVFVELENEKHWPEQQFAYAGSRVDEDPSFSFNDQTILQSKGQTKQVLPSKNYVETYSQYEDHDVGMFHSTTPRFTEEYKSNTQSAFNLTKSDEILEFLPSSQRNISSRNRTLNDKNFVYAHSKQGFETDRPVGNATQGKLTDPNERIGKVVNKYKSLQYRGNI